MKLFALYVGGRAPQSNIEVHDVIFCVASSLEDTDEIIQKKWWGVPERVHVDAFIELTHIDGYAIHLTEELSEERFKLFFVNYGGYSKNPFGEMHESGFFVAQEVSEAIRRGRESLCGGLYQQHLDDCIEIEEVDGYYVSLVPDLESPSSSVVSGYRSINFLSCI